jgi:hypothetical protein
MSRPKLITKSCLVPAVLSKHRNSDPEHIRRFLSLSPSRFWLAAGRTLYPQRAWCISFVPYRALPTKGQIEPKMCFKVLARAENRSDDPGCIHRLLSRSLFFGFRDRLRSAPDRTPYHQQPLGTSWVAWSYPHRVGCQLSDSIVACEYGERQQGFEKTPCEQVNPAVSSGEADNAVCRQSFNSMSKPVLKKKPRHGQSARKCPKRCRSSK